MRMVKVSKALEVNLGQDVTVSFQIVENSIEAVVLTNKDGEVFRIVKSDSYGQNLKVLKEQPFDEEIHIFVVGDLFGNEVNKSFGKKEYASERAANDYVQLIKDELRYLEKCPVSVVERKVKVHYESGEVESTNEVLDPIPF